MVSAAVLAHALEGCATADTRSARAPASPRADAPAEASRVTRASGVTRATGVHRPSSIDATDAIIVEVMTHVAPSVVQLLAAMPPRSAHTPVRALEGEPFVIVRAGPLGTGVVVGHDLVLTTSHVVERAGALRARTAEGVELPAAIVARDRAHDLALLRVSGPLGRALPIAIGAQAPQAGELVLALGDLYGLGPTVTVGVVSHSSPRPGPSAPLVTATLETDAVINLTNTGGPIVNARGELVGIANAKLTEQRAMRGMGYAVAASAIEPLVRSVSASLDTPLRNGEPEQAGALRGIATASLGASQRETYAISENVSHGAVVTRIDSASPAAKVGVEPGDVIVEVDFTPVLDDRFFAQAAEREGPLLILIVRGNAAAYVLVHP